MLSEAEQGCALHSNMNVWPVLTTTRLGPMRTIRGHSTHLSFGTTGFQGDFGGESEEKGLKRRALSEMSPDFPRPVSVYLTRAPLSLQNPMMDHNTCRSCERSTYARLMSPSRGTDRIRGKEWNSRDTNPISGSSLRNHGMRPRISS
jgi:hypothetical protein